MTNKNNIVKDVHDFLINKKATLSLAESVTAGMISASLTDFPGASNYLKLGIVVYSNEAKQNLLHVEKSLLETKGAVCPEVAKQLARNVQKILDTNYAISITGIAGPGGATRENSVGTAFVGIASRNKVEVHRLDANTNNREECRLFFRNKTLEQFLLFAKEN